MKVQGSKVDLGTAEPEARGNWKMISVVLMRFMSSFFFRFMSRKFGKGVREGRDLGIIYVEGGGKYRKGQTLGAGVVE